MSEAGNPVDLERIRLTSEGDRAFEEELFSLFVDDSGKRIGRIAAAVGEEDRETLAHEAHTVKGSAANIGANGMREIALALERCGAEGDWARARRLSAELTAAFGEVRRFMGGYFGAA